MKYPSDMTDREWLLAAPFIPRSLMRPGVKLAIYAIHEGVRVAVSRVFNLGALLGHLARNAIPMPDRAGTASSPR